MHETTWVRVAHVWVTGHRSTVWTFVLFCWTMLSSRQPPDQGAFRAVLYDHDFCCQFGWSNQLVQRLVVPFLLCSHCQQGWDGALGASHMSLQCMRSNDTSADHDLLVLALCTRDPCYCQAWACGVLHSVASALWQLWDLSFRLLKYFARIPCNVITSSFNGLFCLSQ